MRITPFFNKLIAFMLALCFLAAVGSLTVSAEPEDGAQPDPGSVADPDGGAQPDPGSAVDPQIDDGSDTGGNVPSEAGEDPGEGEITEPAQVETAPPEPTEEDYIEGGAEATSAYEEPTHLSELPEAKPGEVPAATAVAVTKVAVNDASVFAGIVMWLCVALGIAVIVGVLVSKRTHRRGA